MGIGRRDFCGAVAIGSMVPFVGGESRAKSGSVARLRICGSGPDPGEFSSDPWVLAQSPRDGIGPIVGSALYEGLTTCDFLGLTHPALARVWSHREFVQWTFGLLDGVSALAVAEYLSDLCDFRGLLKDSSWVFDTAGLVASWVAISPSVLVARLRYPLAVFPKLLAEPVWKIPSSVCGVSGPYRLVEVVGERKPLVRLAGKRQSPGVMLRAPRLDFLDVEVMFSVKKRITALFSGHVDVALSVAGAVDGAIGLPRDSRLLRYRWDVCPALVATAGSVLALEPDTVRAIKTLIVRDTLLRSVYAGYGSVGYDVPVSLGRSHELRWRECSMATVEAIDVLRRFVSRRGPLILAAHYEEHRVLALHVARQLWRGYGIDCRSLYHEVGDPGFWDRPFIVSPWARRVDPRSLLRLLGDSRSSRISWPDFRLSDERFVELLGSASVRSVSDSYVSLLREFACRASVVIPVFPDRVDVVRSRVVISSRSRRFAGFAPDDFVSELARV